MCCSVDFSPHYGKGCLTELQSTSGFIRAWPEQPPIPLLSYFRDHLTLNPAPRNVLRNCGDPSHTSTTGSPAARPIPDSSSIGDGL